MRQSAQMSTSNSGAMCPDLHSWTSVLITVNTEVNASLTALLPDAPSPHSVIPGFACEWPLPLPLSAALPRTRNS